VRGNWLSLQLALSRTADGKEDMQSLLCRDEFFGILNMESFDFAGLGNFNRRGEKRKITQSVDVMPCHLNRIAADLN
jgi:hypothetical protein